MRKILVPVLQVLFLAMVLSACKNEKTEQASTNQVESKPVQGPVVNTVPVAKPKPKKVEPRTVVAAYMSAAVYAAVTDYYFETPKGEILEIRVTNLKKKRKVKLPDDLLVPSQEGPPQQNPDLIGKNYEIDYDEYGKAVSIALKK